MFVMPASYREIDPWLGILGKEKLPHWIDQTLTIRKHLRTTRDDHGQSQGHGLTPADARPNLSRTSHPYAGFIQLTAPVPYGIHHLLHLYTLANQVDGLAEMDHGLL